MNIITGATGVTHVTSNNDGEFNQAIFGDGLVVLANGNKLDAEIINNNLISVKDGDLVMQGRHALIEPGTADEITISTGSAETNRNDLIVARYKLDNLTGYESLTLEVIEGAESSGAAVDPDYTEGVIRTGATLAEYPLYRVRIEGINIVGLDKLFEPIDDIASTLRIIRKTLVAGQTNVIFDNLKINENSVFEFYSSIYGIAPSEVSVGVSSVSTTWEKQETNIEVGISVR